MHAPLSTGAESKTYATELGLLAFPDLLIIRDANRRVSLAVSVGEILSLGRRDSTG